MEIISFIKDKQNADFIQNLMKKSKLKHLEEFEKKKFTLLDFKKWIKENNLHREYVKFETFRDVWGFHLVPNSAISLEDRFFCSLIKRITEYYLQDKFFPSIFNKVRSEASSKKKALFYLKNSNIFARGLKNPEKM